MSQEGQWKENGALQPGIRDWSKVPPTRQLNSRRFSRFRLGGQKSEIKASVWLVSSETSVLGSQVAVFSLCPQGLSSVCLCPNLFCL